MDERFLWGAIAIMSIIIVREILRKKCNFDMDSVDVKNLFINGKAYISNFFSGLITDKNNLNCVVNRSTGDNSLIMLDSGKNKATVLATLRQITDIDYKSAKYIVDNVPSTFMVNMSKEEADLTKKALEFVGAKIEIK